MRKLSFAALAAGLAACLALALAACSSSTPYQPDTGRGGYAEQAISPDTVQVSFHGSSATPADLERDMLLYRCAEIARQQGYDTFQIIEANFPLNVSYNISETHLGGDAHALTVTIKMFHFGQGPQGSQVAQAADLLHTLGPRVNAARPS
ncbi:MAG TPA: hypothetical protein VL359_05825 [bacterium]|nr:hypothetical protein [bacterium]